MTRTEATQEDGTEKENTEMGIKSMSTIQMPIMTLNQPFFSRTRVRSLVMLVTNSLTD